MRAVTEVRPAGGGAVIAARTHMLDAQEFQAARQIITLPVGDYDLAFTVYDAGDGELATDQWTAAVGLGADLRWAPTCEPPVGTLVIHLLEWPASYAVDETLDLRFAVAYAQPGAAEVPAAGAVFTIDVQGGTTANPVGVVGGDGEVITSVLPSAESVEVVISVQGDNDTSATLGLSSDLVTGTVVLTRNFTTFSAEAHFAAAPEECWDGPGVILIGETDFSDINLSLTVGCSVTDNRPPVCVGTNSGTASGSLNVVFNRDPVDGRLLSIQASGTESSVGSAEPPPGCWFFGGASVGGVLQVEFEVTGDVTYRATGSFSGSAENFFVRAGDYIDIVTDPAGFEEVGELSDGIYDVYAQLREYDGSWTFLMEFGP